ncbi:MAG: DUF4147 domain-containing protein [Bacteriovoracaceae bacterium]|jgi:glycerate-2-kinase|nr:DUF4147 domain-containing protein [Bacteriovoracaceae bacterium]
MKLTTAEFNREVKSIYSQLLACDFPSKMDKWIDKSDQLYFLALGKSSAHHSLKFYQQFEGQIKKGLAISLSSFEAPDNLNVFISSHPQLTSLSLEAGEIVVNFLQKIPPNAKLVVFISGGTSAMVEKLKNGFDQSQAQKLNARLLNSGLPIEEINKKRVEYSDLKAGGALKYCQTGQLTVFVSSDIPSEQYEIVGSSPFFKQGQSFPSRELIFDAGRALDLLRLDATSLGVLSGPLDQYISQFLTPLRNGLSVVAMGELGNKIEGTGVGGRCSHFVLVMAYHLFEKNCLQLELTSLQKIVISSIATDGMDGGEKVNAILWDWFDHQSLEIGECAQAIMEFNSHQFFRDHGRLIDGECSGVNFCDLYRINFL